MTQQPQVFTKRAHGQQLGQPLYEAAGLQWLAAAGVPTPKVLTADPNALVTSLLQETPPTPDSAFQLGKDLARLHASGAPWYGAAPPGYSGHSGWIGLAPLPLSAEPLQQGSWGMFYSQLRLRPYVTDVFEPWEQARIGDLCEVLESGALDHPEPDLVQDSGRAASRIHGDLWSGNVMWTPAGATLIDPAAQGGHAEEDLAALQLFGAPYFSQILAGYQSVSPLAPGWERRVPLHQLHLLMVHTFLFGTSYVGATMGAVDASLGLADSHRK